MLNVSFPPQSVILYVTGTGGKIQLTPDRSALVVVMVRPFKIHYLLFEALNEWGSSLCRSGDERQRGRDNCSENKAKAGTQRKNGPLMRVSQTVLWSVLKLKRS